MCFLVCSALELALDRAVVPTPKIVFAVAILFLEQFHTVEVAFGSVFNGDVGSLGRVRVHRHRPFPKHRELLKRRRCNDLRCFVRMDEAAPVSKVTPRVASAQHRLPSGPARVKRHHLVGGPYAVHEATESAKRSYRPTRKSYTFAHFRMGESAATGGEEPTVLPILAGTCLKGSHFRFEWVGLSVCWLKM